MNEVQQIVSLSKNILQPQDNNLRAMSQQTLGSLSQNKPVQLVLVLLQILRSDEPQQIRLFSLTQLKKNLTAFTQEKYKKVWGVASSENQQYIRSTLFECIFSQKQTNVRNILANTIGQIAGSIMSININYWPKFVESVYKLYHQSTQQSLIAFLQILDSFFNHSAHVFDKRGDQVYAIFKNAFNHQNNKVKSSAIKAYSAFLVTTNKKTKAKMESLIIPLYQITYHLLINDKANAEGLQILADLVEVEPKILKKSFKGLFELVQKVMSMKDLEPSVKRIGLQCLITLAEKYPDTFLSSKEKINHLIQMIFVQMINIDEQISQEWKVPPEGYSEDFQKSQDFQATNFGMISFDRLIPSIGENQMIPLLSLTIQKMLSMPDWRYKFASLMALSQIGQYIEDASSIKNIIVMIQSYLSNENPMIRFGACHALGQISDDLRPQFQQLYGKETFLKLALLLKDPVPRVVAHSASAIANVIEDLDYDDISQYAEELLLTLLQHLKTGISLVKQSIFTAIGSFAISAKQQFVPYLAKISEISFSIIQTHKGKQYKQLKGFIIEALTVIAQNVGKEPFRMIAPHLIKYLIKIQDSELDEVDPQKESILEGWRRLCTVFGTQLAPYLSQVLPGLFRLIENITQKHIKNSCIQNILSQDSNTHEQNKINTFETQEAESAISMLNVFVEKMKQFYVPYIQRTANIVIAVIKSQINQNIKIQALTTLPLIVTLTKNSNEQSGIGYAKTFLSILIEVSHKTQDIDLLKEQIDIMKEIFQCFEGNKFLDQHELKVFSEEVIKLFIESNSRKDQNKKQKQNTEDLEEQEEKYFQQKLTTEEETQITISDLIGQIFKTHKQMNTELVSYIINTVFPQVFIEGVSQKMLKFGVFLIDDMIDHLGYAILNPIWNTFAQIFMKFCTHKSPDVRQAICYGLGTYAQHSPNEAFKPYIHKSLQLLGKALEIPKGSCSDKSFNNAQDNVVSAFGKIIKYHGNQFDPRVYLRRWVGYLPLRTDRSEAKCQHLFLTQILLNNSCLLVPDDSTDSLGCLLKILQIFGDILVTKLVTPEITQNIRSCLNGLKSSALFVSNYDVLWSKLSDNQAVKLTNIAKTQ